MAKVYYLGAAALGAVASLWGVGFAFMPAALEEAIACSQTHKEIPVSFTMAYAVADEAPVAMRYDVQTDQWLAVSGDLENLSEDAAEGFAALREEFGKKGGLVPQEIFATLLEPVLLEETQERLVYSFRPGAEEGEDPMPDAMIEALDRRFEIDRQSKCLAGFSMKATMPFKPAAVAKVEAFELAYEFSQPEGSPVPLLSQFRTYAKGNAFFKKFEEKLVVTVSDIELAE